MERANERRKEVNVKDRNKYRGKTEKDEKAGEQLRSREQYENEDHKENSERQKGQRNKE